MPYLSVVIGLDVRAAIAASLVGVVATTSGTATVYVRSTYVAITAIVLVNLLAALLFGFV